MTYQKCWVVTAEWSGIVGMFPHRFKSMYMAFFLIHFFPFSFLFIFFLFSSTVFRIYPHLVLWHNLRENLVVWCLARYSFGAQAYGLTHNRLSDYPIRVLVQLFIDFFLIHLQITAGNLVFFIRIYFPFFFFFFISCS